MFYFKVRKEVKISLLIPFLHMGCFSRFWSGFTHLTHRINENALSRWKLSREDSALRRSRVIMGNEEVIKGVRRSSAILSSHVVGLHIHTCFFGVSDRLRAPTVGLRVRKESNRPCPQGETKPEIVFVFLSPDSSDYFRLLSLISFFRFWTDLQFEVFRFFPKAFSLQKNPRGEITEAPAGQMLCWNSSSTARSSRQGSSPRGWGWKGTSN